MTKQALTVIQETVILGKKIQMYGSIENPLFLARDVANWIEYSASNVSKMLKSVDNDEKPLVNLIRAVQIIKQKHGF